MEIDGPFEEDEENHVADSWKEHDDLRHCLINYLSIVSPMLLVHYSQNHAKKHMDTAYDDWQFHFEAILESQCILGCSPMRIHAEMSMG